METAMDRQKIYISMPRGINFGWGVCGIQLSLTLSELARVRYITDPFTAEDIGDPVQFKRLSSLYLPKENLSTFSEENEPVILQHPILQAIEGKSLRPLYMKVKSPNVIGYIFFETPFLNPDNVARANEYYDRIVAGSTWCQEVLEDQGVRNASTVIQGIDPALFHQETIQARTDFRDQFVVFSGGKLELRKGQDLVIRAFKVLQDRHHDVLLLNSWFNLWDQSLMTMRFSPYITFDMPKGDYYQAITQLMLANGIDPNRVVTLPPLPHAQMPGIYRSTDCGLFPNRCEGGTNLVLMEYMACGRPAIASFSSGHRDVLTVTNSLPVKSMKKFTLKNSAGNIVEQWDDPSLEEIVEKLEWAYQHRDELREIGRKSACSMAGYTWKKAAQAFYDLLVGNS